MNRPTSHLTLVRPGAALPARRRTALDGVTALLLGVSLPPLVGAIAHAGRWGTGAVGLATAIAMLAGRELWHEILDGRRGR